MTEDRTPAVAENPEAAGTDGDERPKGRKNGLYDEVSDELAASMKTGWDDTELHGLAPVAQAAYAAERRAKLSAAYPGERLVVPAGNLRVRANDTEYAFRAASEYVHLTGDRTEDAVLVAEPTGATGHEFGLYLLPRSNRENGEFWLDGNGELWVGRRHSLDEAEQLFGLPARDVRKAAEELKAAAPAPTRIVRGYDAGLEAALAGVLDEDKDTELKEFLSGLRLVKDEWEIGELRAACTATVNGFTDVVRELGQAVATSERWIEGTFWRRARVEGNDVGYGSICAAGPHATTLHWVRNDGDVRPGELLLLDAGVETNTLYTADVTRTLPINGRFDALQRKIYQAVYDAQEAGIAAVRPGGRFRDFHDASQRVLAERLLAWGLLDASVYDVEKVLELGLQRRWTLHGTGHMLGLDVHDCAQARRESYVDAALEPGMVLTVEPGLYFQQDDLTVPAEYRGIGVRIEDDILVTADGNENLSAGLPRSADEVEAWMASLTG
ncbi:Xaa-Pro aminopeptidase 1 [Kitasatospora herbaricolor]|uniref:aminopeptidase P family protein n=1 Tax=Kitasatospora herbaricolor TaxID=68217 RepID=UPI00174D3CA5|nr:aminopeptidase P family protein [Kitasatospora herbaricolor]MDQ0309431.1 Xaa-Pro aminopeptidase [Kitasatospora herbaricolor]GGV01855.1 Xaa-Pro aminopeptidase 1 [Kitasatospora herbaricolor]